MSKVKLQITPWLLSVCKLTTDTIPNWSNQSRFLSFTRTPYEHSLVCEAVFVPKEIKAESNWSCIKVEGILDFSLIGIIAGITQILASKQISVFVISTFDTDYLLVKQEKLAQAKSVLELNGYLFT